MLVFRMSCIAATLDEYIYLVLRSHRGGDGTGLKVNCTGEVDTGIWIYVTCTIGGIDSGEWWGRQRREVG
jgi:hypothetical protein